LYVFNCSLNIKDSKNNYYSQVVDEIYDKFAAGQMGIERKGQVRSH